MFETIYDSSLLQPVLELGWTKLDLPLSVALSIREAALYRIKNQDLRPAKLSQSSKIHPEIRNDSTFWISTEKSLTSFEIEMMDQLNIFKKYLKEFFLMPLSDFELHWAYYPKNHFYKKHKDITDKNNKRILSFVLYLNENWNDSDGGHNVGYKDGTILWKIKPDLGTLLLFNSEIEHEVQPTNRDRLSLTGWFRSL